jgi:hypothetical protein
MVVMRDIATLFAIASTLLIAVAVLTIAAIAAVRRGRHSTRSSGSLGHAMQEIEGLFVESRRHVLRAERAEEAGEEDAGGDPPEK